MPLSRSECISCSCYMAWALRSLRPVEQCTSKSQTGSYHKHPAVIKFAKGSAHHASTNPTCRSRSIMAFVRCLPSACVLCLLLFSQHVASQSNEARRRAYEQAVMSVYRLAIYPLNEAAIRNFQQNGPPPQVLDSSICGRVHPFGTHCTPVGVAEYFYGLTPNNITFDSLAPFVIKEVHLTQFLVDTKQRKAFSTINYYIDAPTGTSPYALNATQLGTWRFDTSDRIVEFDLWNPLYSTTVRQQTPADYLRSQAYQNDLISVACARYDRFCSGHKDTPDGYKTIDDCKAFMQTLLIGEPDVFSANNLLCRHQHATLIQLRPEIHCPHVGRLGGGFCVDTPFPDYFTKPLFPADPDRLVAPASFVAVARA